MARLFVYVVAADTGFAPNPPFDLCTLACCQPVINRAAGKDDYLVGLSPRAQGNRLVYPMKIWQKLTSTKYWQDRRFERKKADPYSKDALRRAGDNIYEPIPENAEAPRGYRQHPCLHSLPNSDENTKTKRHDLGGK